MRLCVATYEAEEYLDEADEYLDEADEALEPDLEAGLVLAGGGEQLASHLLHVPREGADFGAQQHFLFNNCNIFVRVPRSLYLLLNSESGRVTIASKYEKYVERAARGRHSLKKKGQMSCKF